MKIKTAPLFILLSFPFILSSLSIAGKFTVGDKVRTNESYNRLYEKSKKGIVLEVTESDKSTIYNLPNASIRYPVLTLDTGEDISEYWLEKDLTWYVGQKVWDILFGRGVIEKIEDPSTCRYNITVRFENGESSVYTSEGKQEVWHENVQSRLYPIGVKNVIFSLDKLYPKTKCDCECCQDTKLMECIVNGGK